MPVVQDTFFGGTLASALSDFASIDIISGGRSGMTATDINTSYSGTTGTNMTFIPADLIDGGSFDFTIAYDPDDDLDAIMGISDTWTVTYPLPSGSSNAATVIFTGYLNSISNALPIDDRMTLDISIKVANAPNHTAKS